MARHKSAMKQLRAGKRREKRNKQVKSRLKSLVKNVQQTTSTNETDKIKSDLTTAISELQRAANRKIIHKNTASRKISRLTKKVNQSINSNRNK